MVALFLLSLKKGSGLRRSRVRADPALVPSPLLGGREGPSQRGDPYVWLPLVSADKAVWGARTQRAGRATGAPRSWVAEGLSLQPSVRAPRGIGDVDEQQRKTCGFSPCRNRTITPARQSLDFIHAGRRERCLNSSMNSFHS